MRTLSSIRRFEPLFLIGIVVLYITRRLIQELDRIDSTIGLASQGNGIPAGAFWRYLDNYDHTLNNNVPLILGAVICLGAWYVFHYIAYPLLNKQPDDQKGWLYTGLTIVLLLLGVGVYHYFKLYVRYQHDQSGQIIGLKVYSLYRKRTVLADAIGFGIIIGAYELAYQYYQFLSHRIARESESHFRLVSLLLLGGLCVMAVSLALNLQLPQTLWHRGMHDVLLVLGLVIQILCLQAYVYSYILPLLKAPLSMESALVSSIATYLLTIGIATTVLWGAATNFWFGPRDPIIAFSGIVLAVSLSIAYARQVLTKEKSALQEQVSVSAAELSSLRAQINPHFLFNALNSLYATSLKERAEKTADGIQKLGDMMRFMLHENNRDRIPLDKEIEYLRNYIEIQRMRIDETHDITIRVTIQEPTRPIYLAPMLLTPFVENAFKHGISFRQPSWIDITLTLDDTQLYFKVHNSRHTKTHNNPEAANSGVGLNNVRKRLELIYPGRHQLIIQESQEDFFVALTLVYW